MKVTDDRCSAVVLKVLFLGTPCPLCSFAGHVWVGGMEEEIIENIRDDFPRWSPEEGACERCIEAYRPPRLI